MDEFSTLCGQVHVFPRLPQATMSQTWVGCQSLYRDCRKETEGENNESRKVCWMDVATSGGHGGLGNPRDRGCAAIITHSSKLKWPVGDGATDMDILLERISNPGLPR